MNEAPKSTDSDTELGDELPESKASDSVSCNGADDISVSSKTAEDDESSAEIKINPEGVIEDTKCAERISQFSVVQNEKSEEGISQDSVVGNKKCEEGIGRDSIIGNTKCEKGINQDSVV